ncbi:MAG TPA: 3-dehydroquinate synthase family protein [Chitinophagaceae bacterium]|nr:3-dehydroquinate synthase family protein [Chitinophagaceae bacterium]
MRPFLFFADEAERFNAWLKGSGFSKIILVADANTNGFCVPLLRAKIPVLQRVSLLVIPQGEVHKNLETVTYIWHEMDRLGVDRYSLIVNVGGGVVSDMAGFAAAIYKRGIAYVNIPTTLIAMLDASVGGKTGIDFHHVKNHLGCVHHPLAVFVDPHFLNTLDDRILRSGISEAIKHHILAGQKEDYRQQTIPSFYTLEAIRWSLEFKLAIVEQDPNDLHIRQQLNLGHTIGHAIESDALTSSYPLYHGEAIWLGLLIELRISELLFHYPATHRLALLEAWSNYFPHLSVELQQDRLIQFLQQDKKNKQGLRMSLMSQIGECKTGVEVSVDVWQKAINSFRSM